MSDEFRIPENGVIYFYNNWNLENENMNPILKELGQNFYIQKVNTEEDDLMSKYFDVISTPAFVVIKDGKEVKRFLGEVSKQKLESALRKIYSDI